MDHESWLKLTQEEIIDPELRICDAHHHLWDGPGERGRYLLEELRADMSTGHNFTKTIFAECGNMYRMGGPEELRPVGETEFVRSITSQPAERRSPIAIATAIIGYADLTLGERVSEVLEAHLLAGGNTFKGIRQSCTWDENTSIVSMAKSRVMMADRKFREGFACLQKYGLSFDAWQYFTQLGELSDLAAAFPEIKVIINHTGGILGVGQYARQKDDMMRRWASGMRTLASLPNTYVKLGGLGMPRCGFGWHQQKKPPGAKQLAEAMKPYYLFCIEIFGVKRCMFESNFPVDRISYPYHVLWNAFKLVTKGSSDDEREALFYSTANEVYRLDG